jgi:hypothetical protein
MKSPIRIEIEKILGREHHICFIDSCVGWGKPKIGGNYRMKIVEWPEPEGNLTKREKSRIEKLPHVLRVKYLSTLRYPGICIYFDCKPSQIKL